MDFKNALKALKEGRKIKLPTWLGYWVMEDNSIKMHTKEGTVLDIRDTQDVFYTFNNIASDKWQIVSDNDLRKLAKYPVSKEYETFSFSEAIRKLKEGKKVARTGWNGKGMYIWLLPPAMVKREWCRDERLLECFGDGENELNCLGSIRMFTYDSTGRTAVLTGWLASQSDILSDDWYEVF